MQHVSDHTLQPRKLSSPIAKHYSARSFASLASSGWCFINAKLNFLACLATLYQQGSSKFTNLSLSASAHVLILVIPKQIESKNSAFQLQEVTIQNDIDI